MGECYNCDNFIKVREPQTVILSCDSESQIYQNVGVSNKSVIHPSSTYVGRTSENFSIRIRERVCLNRHHQIFRTSSHLSVASISRIRTPPCNERTKILGHPGGS